MKRIKILTIGAFVIGIAGAFTAKPSLGSANLYKSIGGGNCSLVQCSSTGTTTCDVETSTTLFVDGQCPNGTAYTGSRYIPN